MADDFDDFMFDDMDDSMPDFNNKSNVNADKLLNNINDFDSLSDDDIIMEYDEPEEIVKSESKPKKEKSLFDIIFGERIEDEPKDILDNIDEDDEYMLASDGEEPETDNTLKGLLEQEVPQRIKDAVVRQRKNEFSSAIRLIKRFRVGVLTGLGGVLGITTAAIFNNLFTNDLVRIGKGAFTIPVGITAKLMNPERFSFVYGGLNGILDGMSYDSISRLLQVSVFGQALENRSLMDRVVDSTIGSQDQEGRILGLFENLMGQYSSGLGNIFDNLASKIEQLRVNSRFINTFLMFNNVAHSVDDESEILTLNNDLAYLILEQTIEVPTYIYPELVVYFSPDGGTTWLIDNTITIVNADSFTKVELIPLLRQGMYKIKVNKYLDTTYAGATLPAGTTKTFKLSANVYGNI